MNQGKLEVVKQEMARVNIDIPGISELKWTGMGEFNSDDHYIYYCGQESLRKNEVAIMVNKRVQNAVLGCNLKNDRMISVHFQGKPFNITVIQLYASASNAEEAKVERFYEDLQDLLELTPKKDVLFIIGDWNAKVGSQETPGVTGKFGLGLQNEARQRLIEFCQENTLIIGNTREDSTHGHHKMVNTKVRLKLKKVGKTTRPVRYDLNQIPYDYTVEVTNRFKGLDLIDRVPKELWTEVCNIVQETEIKTMPKKKKCKKAKWLSEEALQIAVKRREVKSKGEKERYKHLNAEFQRIARRDKKAFLSDQCKEIEGNNRMGKTRDLFKKIRDTKGTFHAKMGSKKDRNGMDLTEAEDTKKRWQKYTELYKKDLMTQITARV